MKKRNNPKEKIGISVVVPAYNEESSIAKCLEAIKGQKTKKIFEILVVNNNSKDKTKEIAKSFKVKIIDEKKQGVGQARKTGTEKAKGDIVIHIDADTRLFPDHLEKVYKHFKKDKDLVCLGGQFVFYDAHFYKNILRKILYRPFLIFAKITSRNALGPTGSNMAFRKSAYEKTKGFDKNLKFGEDIDICRKLKKFGKIKTDLSLKVGVSSRRFKLNKKLLTYTTNFFFSCFFKKPYKNELEKALGSGAKQND